uniref:NB-ARC domain-containing protein n=1 Tax=Leersia perrieri TaxID=77586 RepID=A0A0D9X4Y3_9ORYZ
MEAMPVDASTGVMNTLLSKLSKLLEEYTNIKGLTRNQITFLRDELSRMKPVLEMLADIDELDPLKKEWRDNVRELAFDIEDYTDSFMVRVNHGSDELPTGFKGFFRKLKKLKACPEISDEIDELIKTCAMESCKRHKRYKSVDVTSNSSTFGVDPRVLMLYDEVDKLVGVDGPKKHIIDWLTKDKDDKNLKVLTFMDLGSLRKKTLAVEVYCQVEDQFQCKSFFPMSRNLSRKKILRSIYTYLGITDNTPDDEGELIDRIRDYLKHKRYFIVIDDVWDEEAWKTIKLVLLNNRRGSRIVTTTRNAAVASCCTRDSDYVYQMKPLSLRDSKLLFFKRAFGSEDLPHPHLEKITDGILEKCDGLPLVIMIMSSLLADQHAEDEWERMLTDIDCALTKDPDIDIVKRVLSLSYYGLPHHLRACLLYLSIFPEGYEIDKQRLINRWIAEGFVHEEQGLSSYEVGEGYFNYLINKSLIQPVGSKHGKAKACQVHGIILDFLACKASEENFNTPSDAAEQQGLVSDNKVRVRRLCINNRNNNEIDTRLKGPNLSHVRSLTVFGDFGKTNLSDFTALHVLDQENKWSFGENWGSEDYHIANIQKLLHLRYLRLSSLSLNFDLTAKIEGLQNLETLDLLGLSIIELPSAITRLRRLARLYIGHLARFPNGTIVKMVNLEELTEFGIMSNDSYQQWKYLQELSQLTKLRTLKVTWDFEWSFVQSEEGLQSHVQSFISSCNVHNLYIRSIRIWPSPYPLSLKSCCPTNTCNLQKLHITYCFICKIPNWMSSLQYLRELKLYIYCIRQEDVEILGAIPRLIFLKLKTFYGTNGRILVPGYKGFRCLKYFGLVIMSCGTTPEFGEGSMPKLEHLKIRFCAHEEECLNGVTDFSFASIQQLSNLNKVEVHIYGCLVSCKDYDPDADMEDSNAKSAACLIKAAVKALPNRVICSFELAKTYGRLGTFHGLIKALNRHTGIPAEKILQEFLKLRVKQMIQNNKALRGLLNR